MTKIPYFRYLVWLALLFSLQARAYARQDTALLDSYLERIETAQQMRNYNLALRLLQEAQKQYPKNSLLLFINGELYEQQNLLHLGLESYLQALKLEPQNTRYLYRVANSQNRLGKYSDAVKSFSLLEQWGNSYERNQARHNNGWLLYKLHRYSEAEAKILAIPPQQRSSSTMMTLAIIHSAAYDYEKSRNAYEQSIALTYPQLDETTNSSHDDESQTLYNLQTSINQRALIYYNYALLETDFHHFDRAMELNDQSIQNISFPSNELLRGELYLQQRHFHQAREAFIKSQRLEEQSKHPSPLALLDLVQLSIDQGQNTEGMVFMRELDLRFRKQTEWMTSYGIDSIKFELELMELRTALYKGLLQEQKWLLPITFSESMQRFGALLKYSWLYWYSLTQQKLLAYQVGKEHYQQGNELDSNKNLYDASDSHSLLKRRFFQQLKSENLSFIPESKDTLLLEEGILERNSEKIEQSLTMLDPKWDADAREKAYIELSQLRKYKQLSQRYQELLQAYHINRAALKLHGIALPIQLQLSGSVVYRPEQQYIKRQLQRYLSHAGAEIVSDTTMPVLRLQIQWSKDQVRAYLLSEKGIVLSNIDSSKLQELITMRQAQQLSASQQRRLLKQFSRKFMQQALTPNR